MDSLPIHFSAEEEAKKKIAHEVSFFASLLFSLFYYLTKIYS